ncbi:MAG: hypothetical protein G01um101433_891 [Parcubacteria group bacterium Gr01-1014_33]|nr:MAG: hypothetical protein G01um101433_891 [Parcubacteria group bacterium Gr01-1014_33]
MWHTDVLPQATKHALDFLSTQHWLKKSKWYLAGGTALALQVGHRQSIDLDFFLPHARFSGEDLIDHLGKEWRTDVFERGTIYGKLLGAKTSFIGYPFFKSRQTPLWYGSVRVLVPEDIAVMKITAVSQRGRKRDFIDLYWYALNREPLLEIVRRLPDQYPNIAHDYHHILKSMMYFADAESDPMPRVFFKADWKTVKAYFTREIPIIAKKLLRLG